MLSHMSEGSVSGIKNPVKTGKKRNRLGHFNVQRGADLPGTLVQVTLQRKALLPSAKQNRTRNLEHYVSAHILYIL